MKTKANYKSHGLTLIEFFLSIIALFLLLIITYPILQDYSERSEKRRIINNLNQISYHSKIYFRENDNNSVSLYELVGPRKAIPELKIIADEVYPKIIYRNQDISANSEKHGLMTIR